MQQQADCTEPHLLFGLICGRKSSLEVLDSSLLLLRLLLQLRHPILSTHMPDYSACPHTKYLHCSFSHVESVAAVARVQFPRSIHQLSHVPAFSTKGFGGAR
jgi:hypothetical protein